MSHNQLDLPAGGNDAGHEEEFSFELDERIITALAGECDPLETIKEFIQAVEKGSDREAAARDIFETYGKEWMIKTLELGEKYTDQTYEVLKEAAKKTGAIAFPHIPQRALEIAYTCTKGIRELPIVENNPGRLAYKMVNCSTHKYLVEQCGRETADMLPCRYACLKACETLKKELGIMVDIVMEASTPKDGFCQFSLSATPAS
ncbi:MAG: hypothetical protein HN737_03600 [Desulfobacterales bacterium]|jgi:hypothetical protein|nr:hypothetical protein [Desulfobacteraceae bacterium]MBT4363794.1 hypothetical protein [Desulfobacteraceae bacterium]MBT7085623.1 hypothetical protein [Desulfobacterales bacterium]MBT7696477.1 hypothetical protein [Desulfobacterales bacterium]